MQRFDSLPQLHAPAQPVAPKVAGNLCAEAQGKVLRTGVLCFCLSLAAAIALAKAGVAHEWRWLLAGPFFVAIVGVSEALLQTCPFMALHALRDQGEGIVPIGDPKERAALRARGKRLLWVSGAIALAAAGLFAELPL